MWNFGQKTYKDRDAFGNLGVDGRIILKYLLEKCSLRMWIH
jgi:hypothetical protein